MKALFFIFLTFAQLSLFAQHKIKKVTVEGDGIPLVMLAGGTADQTVYSSASAELSNYYKVIRMDHYNVQYADEGSTLPGNYSVNAETRGVRRTLDSMHIQEPIILVGHSYGALIAFDFALHYPDRIRSLILLEPPLFDIAEAKNEAPEGMKNMESLLKELQPKAKITDEMVERFRCALLNCDTIAIRQHPQWSTWVKQKNRLRGLSAVAKYKVDFKQLREFSRPVLIMTGTATVPFHRRIDELLRKEFVYGNEVMIKSGHTIPSTAPEEMIKCILQFIK